MDTTHLDLRVRFDEDFSFESPSLPCSSSGSYSTPSTASPSQDPFTPMSGRSTPGLQPLLMDHDNVVCGTSASFGLTPPASTFNGYYPSETRSDSYRYMGYESFSATPSRRASVQAGAMDYECAPMMPTPMASRNTSYQSTNGPGLGNQPFADQIASSPLEFPPPPYPLDNSAYDTAPSWTWPGDSPVNFFERHNSPSTANLQNVLLGESHYVSPQNFPHHGTRRLCLDGVQQKTTALHRVQRYRPSKRSRQPKTTSIGEKSVIVFTRGSHSCPKDDCIGRKPFRRQEHLKRHLKT
jgi:hypothetical protein